jgi:hypothetical protein
VLFLAVASLLDLSLSPKSTPSPSTSAVNKARRAFDSHPIPSSFGHAPRPTIGRAHSTAPHHGTRAGADKTHTLDPPLSLPCTLCARPRNPPAGFHFSTPDGRTDAGPVACRPRRAHRGGASPSKRGAPEEGAFPLSPISLSKKASPCTRHHHPRAGLERHTTHTTSSRASRGHQEKPPRALSD